ncbi:PREDICTED: uncharacterized protein LOC105567428, partial [Vollenhovia emeryi]|uniref:uncharacterized protein LOC105567428 n=1 Tax=Vollenhovia emeryi TaxID=411798 RepID=UPI0005F50480
YPLNGYRFPFIIGVWYGHSKPDYLEGYLSNFIEEVKNLTTNGYDFHGKNIAFSIDTYNTALKAVKTVLEGEETIAQTEVETDYDKPRKRKKNRKYTCISSSSENKEADDSSNILCGTSNEIPAPNALLPNKLKALLKNKSVKTSAVFQQKATSVGKLFSRNKSCVKSISSLTYNNNTLKENPVKQHSSSILNEASKKSLSPQSTMNNNEPTSDSSSTSMSTLSVQMQCDRLGRKHKTFLRNINKTKSSVTPLMMMVKIAITTKILLI